MKVVSKIKSKSNCNHGSGMSCSSLYIVTLVAKEIAKLRGGSINDYLIVMR